MSQEITHDKDASRYVITVDGAEAGFAAYETAGDVLDFNHTEVYQEFQGQGLSKPLVKAALDDVRVNGRTIIPSCSAVERFIAKNPEYQDVVQK